MHQPSKNTQSATSDSPEALSAESGLARLYVTAVKVLQGYGFWPAPP
jgi:hypothetical protein